MLSIIRCPQSPRSGHRLWEGFLLYDFLKVIPDAEIYGIDISDYAIANSKPEIRDRLQVGNAIDLPWNDNSFDLVISITTVHNLQAYDLDLALREMERVGKQHKYLCVESYRNEQEKGESSLLAGHLRSLQYTRRMALVVQANRVHRRSFLHLLRVTPWPCGPQQRKQQSSLLSTSHWWWTPSSSPRNLDVGQVLVELQCSGICGSQLGEIDGVKGPDRYLPHLMGHEGFARGAGGWPRGSSRPNRRQCGAALATGCRDSK